MTSAGEPAPIRAILFDMDGTLVDSNAAVERAWAQWARTYGVPVEEVLSTCHGGTTEATIHRYLGELPADEVERQLADHLEYECSDLDDVVAAPGATDLVARLDARGVPWAVVTNAPTPLARARLGAAGIEPPVLVPRDEVSAGKPDPEGFVAAAERIGVPTDHCLVVEDSPSGIAAGIAAGAQVAGVGGVEAPIMLEGVAEVERLLSHEGGSASSPDPLS